MVQCRFYSRQQGWPIDKRQPSMKYFYSELFEVSPETFKTIKGLNGHQISKLNINNDILNTFANNNKHWYLYSKDVNIGCYTTL